MLTAGEYSHTVVRITVNKKNQSGTGGVLGAVPSATV